MRKQFDEDVDTKIATLIGYTPPEGMTMPHFYSQDAALATVAENAIGAAQQWCFKHPGEWEFVQPQKLAKSNWWVAMMIRINDGSRGKKYTGFDLAPAGAVCQALISMMRKL